MAPMGQPVNHTWNVSLTAYLTDGIFEGQLIAARVIYIIPFMALFIPTDARYALRA
jgi:hypothetical protein